MNREETLLGTLGRILASDPLPDELLVYIDGGDARSAQAVRRTFDCVRVLEGGVTIGPGGGRSLLLAAAQHDLIASFDDDSFPLDRDYFRRLSRAFAQNPSAAVVAARIFHRGEPIADIGDRSTGAADFVACGCGVRKSAVTTVGGFVPLPLAYGMEESDLALRLHAAGFKIVSDAGLRVRHDSDLAHHARPDVTAASIRNLALFAYLRYPPTLWWLGAAQVARRVLWLIRHGRLRGVMAGLVTIPAHLRRYRMYRHRLQAGQVRAWLAARRAAGAG